MKKWKKNFRKVPIDILTKLDQIKSDIILVSCAKKIPLSDIENGFYKHLGITVSDSAISFDQSAIPEKDSGRYSKYNVLGREIVLRHLPRVITSYSADVPNFGDWSNGSHDITWSREVYQREYWIPRHLNINIQLLENNQNEFTFKFSIDTPLSKQDVNFMDDLLYHCNVLQENVGLCDVFAADSNDTEYIDTLYVDWELLPPGSRNIDNNVEVILTTVRSHGPELESIIRERMMFFETLDLQTYIRGKNKFSQYFGAVLNNGLVILENVRYGNAIYVFKSDWENFSKLSRTELIRMQNGNIIRIPHTNNWKYNVKSTIARAS